jgi:hypothetical protein
MMYAAAGPGMIRQDSSVGGYGRADLGAVFAAQAAGYVYGGEEPGAAFAAQPRRGSAGSYAPRQLQEMQAGMHGRAPVQQPQQGVAAGPGGLLYSYEGGAAAVAASLGGRDHARRSGSGHVEEGRSRSGSNSSSSSNVQRMRVLQVQQGLSMALDRKVGRQQLWQQQQQQRGQVAGLAGGAHAVYENVVYDEVSGPWDAPLAAYSDEEAA